MRSRMAMDLLGGINYVDPFADIAQKKALKDAINDRIGDILEDKLVQRGFDPIAGAVPPTHAPFEQGDILGDLIEKRLGISLPSINPVIY